ncbi:MAG: nuclear transport factor 2 family protein [Pseudomonadales bacterium]|nr:nuclear transport factor 2 family protein [Pseudomonadales bacterium]
MSDDKKSAALGPITKATMGISAGRALNVSQGGLDELRRDIQMLMDIEAIRQLKHAYFRCVDTANFTELAELFHDEVTVHFIGGTYEWKLNGKAEYLAAVTQAFNAQAIGHHNGHHPEIQILSETEATGIWYLADNMWQLSSNHFTTGTAIYWDRYRKVDGRWLMIDTRYRRIYELNSQLPETPRPATHYLGAFGTTLPAK